MRLCKNSYFIKHEGLIFKTFRAQNFVPNIYIQLKIFLKQEVSFFIHLKLLAWLTTLIHKAMVSKACVTFLFSIVHFFTSNLLFRDIKQLTCSFAVSLKLAKGVLLQIGVTI
jgi:hypothetical protein